MSQIGTTIEQSRRLIAAGVRPETADMAYRPWTRSAAGFDLVTDFESGKVFFQEDDIHAWSLSALWDLLNESKITLEYATNRSSEALIESLVTAIERFAKQGRM